MENDEKSMKIIKNPLNCHPNLPKTTKNLKIDQNIDRKKQVKRK